ncbi:MAG TPA: hypothetical protein [Caudoviricetes sp.]|nr:MAG TPA: hypothetical protein [Caudoviricetes sp.]
MQVPTFLTQMELSSNPRVALRTIRFLSTGLTKQ